MAITELNHNEIKLVSGGGSGNVLIDSVDYTLKKLAAVYCLGEGIKTYMRDPKKYKGTLATTGICLFTTSLARGLFKYFFQGSGG